MRKLSFVFLLLWSVVVFAQSTIKDNGNIVSQERTIPKYSKILLKGSISVMLTNGDVGKLTIKASDNIQDYIITKVINNELQIHLKPNYNYSLTKEVKVYVPIDASVSGINLKGSGSITSEKELTAQNLQCELEGSGNLSLSTQSQLTNVVLKGSGIIEIAGNTNKLNIALSGSGNINAFSLSAKNANISLSGSGIIETTATEELNTSLLGSGNLYVKGNPAKINKKVLGSGSIKIL